MDGTELHVGVIRGAARRPQTLDCRCLLRNAPRRPPCLGHAERPKDEAVDSGPLRAPREVSRHRIRTIVAPQSLERCTVDDLRNLGRSKKRRIQWNRRATTRFEFVVNGNELDTRAFVLQNIPNSCAAFKVTLVHNQHYRGVAVFTSQFVHQRPREDLSGVITVDDQRPNVVCACRLVHEPCLTRSVRLLCRSPLDTMRHGSSSSARHQSVGGGEHVLGHLARPSG